MIMSRRAIPDSSARSEDMQNPLALLSPIQTQPAWTVAYSCGNRLLSESHLVASRGSAPKVKNTCILSLLEAIASK